MLNQHQIVRCLPAIGLLLSLVAVPSAAADSFPWQRYLEYPGVWYEGFEAKRIAINVLSHQSPQGAWPKNVDTGAKAFEGDPNAIRGSFENMATLGELRFLARIYGSNNDNRYRTAFDKGLKHLLDCQYPVGSWPLTSTPPKIRTIVFNDGCTLDILQFLREVATSKTYGFVRKDSREACLKAFDRGVECLVNCQVYVDDEPAAWCGRYDINSLEPRQGKLREPVALNAPESAAILLFLMSINDPDEATVRAIHGGCAWFDTVRLVDIRVQKQNGDVVVVRAKGAPLLWARFYEIGKNRALFTRRDGVVKHKLADIEIERRNELVWYAPWGQPVLERYAVWNGK